MKNIKFFDYQEDMKERIEKALRLHRSVMAQMPTGTGKTVLLASVVESFLREHPSKTVWIVAHRRELVSQIKDTLNKFLLNFSFSNHPVPLSKEGSTSHSSPLSSEERDVTAPTRRSEPLRSKVGGASEPSPGCAGWDRLAGGLGISSASDNLIEKPLLFHINNEACQIFSGRLFVFYIKLSFMLEIPLGA